MTTERHFNFQGLQAWRGVVVLAVAAAAVSLYAYFIPSAPGGRIILEWRLFARLGSGTDSAVSADLRAYALRFASSFIFLGLMPFLLLMLLGAQENLLRGCGLGKPRGGLFSWKAFPFFWIVFVAVGIAGAFDPQLAAFYPYSKTLTLESGTLGNFLLHGSSYVVFYYLPWEFLFRGVLILPLLPLLLEGQDGQDSINPRSMTVASIQVIPSALLHFGHPITESLGAVVFGVIAGYTVLRYRSIWPALILHGSTGLALDLALTIKAGI